MYQIGVDIGGTNIKVGLVNETMELVQTCSVRFPHDGARSVVKTIEEAVDFLLRQQAIARKDVESVGIVVPGSARGGAADAGRTDGRLSRGGVL